MLVFVKISIYFMNLRRLSTALNGHCVVLSRVDVYSVYISASIGNTIGARSQSHVGTNILPPTPPPHLHPLPPHHKLWQPKRISQHCFQSSRFLQIPAVFKHTADYNRNMWTKLTSWGREGGAHLHLNWSHPLLSSDRPNNCK